MQQRGPPITRSQLRHDAFKAELSSCGFIALTAHRDSGTNCPRSVAPAQCFLGSPSTWWVIMPVTTAAIKMPITLALIVFVNCQWILAASTAKTIGGEHSKNIRL